MEARRGGGGGGFESVRLEHEALICLAAFFLPAPTLASACYHSIRSSTCPPAARPPARPPLHTAAGVWRSAAALLGDVASALPSCGLLFQQKPFVEPFLQGMLHDSVTASSAQFAMVMIEKALAAGQQQQRG